MTSYQASKGVVSIASECGLLELLQEHDEEIRRVLSPEVMPNGDAELAGKDVIYEMMESAKKSDRIYTFDPARFQASAPSAEKLARALVVQLDLHLSWSERPKVDKGTGKNRLKIGAILGQGVFGGALAGVNLSLGVLGNYIPHIPAMVGQVSTSLGIAASTYTGLTKVFEAVEKLAAELKE